MPVRPIVIYPDPRLREVAAPVETFGADLAALATDLADTMRAAPGIGITAPHIGVALRVVVLALPEDEAPVTYVNPEIVEASAELFRHVEGSVSMPGVAEDVERPAKVRVRYQDLAGDVHEEAAEGLRAVCHQHEIDQLDGKFWLQSLSRLKRDRVIKRYEKLRRAG